MRRRGKDLYRKVRRNQMREAIAMMYRICRSRGLLP